jgi:hypothetical protein
LDLVRKQNFGARTLLLAGFDRSSIAKSRRSVAASVVLLNRPDQIHLKIQCDP